MLLIGCYISCQNQHTSHHTHAEPISYNTDFLLVYIYDVTGECICSMFFITQWRKTIINKQISNVHQHICIYNQIYIYSTIVPLRLCAGIFTNPKRLQRFFPHFIKWHEFTHKRYLSFSKDTGSFIIASQTLYNGVLSPTHLFIMAFLANISKGWTMSLCSSRGGGKMPSKHMEDEAWIVTLQMSERVLQFERQKSYYIPIVHLYGDT